MAPESVTVERIVTATILEEPVDRQSADDAEIDNQLKFTERNLIGLLEFFECLFRNESRLPAQSLNLLNLFVYK